MVKIAKRHASKFGAFGRKGLRVKPKMASLPSITMLIVPVSLQISSDNYYLVPIGWVVCLVRPEIGFEIIA